MPLNLLIMQASGSLLYIFYLPIHSTCGNSYRNSKWCTGLCFSVSKLPGMPRLQQGTVDQLLPLLFTKQWQVQVALL